MRYAFSNLYVTITLKEGEEIQGFCRFTGWVTECTDEYVTLLLESIVNPGQSRGTINIHKSQLGMGGIAINEVQKCMPELIQSHY